MLFPACHHIRVARYVDLELWTGEIVEHFPVADDQVEPLWNVVWHRDGEEDDNEDLDAEELLFAVQLRRARKLPSERASETDWPEPRRRDESRSDEESDTAKHLARLQESEAAAHGEADDEPESSDEGGGESDFDDDESSASSDDDGSDESDFGDEDAPRKRKKKTAGATIFVEIAPEDSPVAPGTKQDEMEDDGAATGTGGSSSTASSTKASKGVRDRIIKMLKVGFAPSSNEQERKNGTCSLARRPHSLTRPTLVAMRLSQRWLKKYNLSEAELMQGRDENGELKSEGSLRGGIVSVNVVDPRKPGRYVHGDDAAPVQLTPPTPPPGPQRKSASG